MISSAFGTGISTRSAASGDLHVGAEAEDPDPGVESLRVCILAETYYPIIGGGETQARLLAEQLVVRGHRVLLVTRRSDSSLPSDEILGGVQVRRIGPVGPGGVKRWPMIATAASTLVARRNAFDIILVLGFRALGLAGSIGGLLDKPWILKAESNGEMSGEFFHTRLARHGVRPSSSALRLGLGFRNRILRRADAFVAISSVVENELLSHGIPSARIVRIPNAVDTARFRPASDREKLEIRLRLGLPDTGPIFVYTGRLVRYKGLPMLLRAWERVVAASDEAHLLLVGTGGQDIENCESELRSYVHDRGLTSNVTFTGPVENVHDYLRASDAFLFPTQNEAFGISLIEAMSCGLPSLSSPTGGVLDIVQDGDNGIIVPEFEEGSWSEQMLRLIEDPGIAADLRTAARSSVLDRYRPASVVGAYEALLASCLPASGSPAGA